MGANPNTLTPSFPEYWSKRMQLKHYKSDVFRKIVSMEEQATLERGDTVHRPYRSEMTVNDLGADGAYSRQAITDTDESLSINKEKEVSFYIRKIDEMQSNYRTANEYADDAAVLLGNQIDGDVLGEYASAASDVDDGDIGGTSGNGIALSVSNIDKIFGKANEKLDEYNVPENKRFAVISPQFYNVLWQRIGGKETMLGDKTGENGNVGTWAGFKLYKSNNLSWTGTLAMDTNPTDGDAIVIRGVTITFRATLTTASGSSEVHIASTVDITRANLTEFLNAPTTSEAEATDTGYSSMSTANANKLKNFTFTNDNTANTMTVVAKGVSKVVVSETLTAATGLWTEALQIQHNLFGYEGAIDLVIQKQPNMIIKDRDGYIGKDVVSWTVYGFKTFNLGTTELVDVKIKSANF